jgi:hypothetical protein
MTVKELINELSKFEPDRRVFLYNHGAYDSNEQPEILGCYDSALYDNNDNEIEKIVELYEY